MELKRVFIKNAYVVIFGISTYLPNWVPQYEGDKKSIMMFEPKITIFSKKYVEMIVKMSK